MGHTCSLLLMKNEALFMEQQQQDSQKNEISDGLIPRDYSGQYISYPVTSRMNAYLSFLWFKCNLTFGLQKTVFSIFCFCCQTADSHNKST